MNIIKSKQNAKIKALVALKKAPGAELLIEGKNLIEMALGANLVKEIYAVEALNYSVPMTLITPEIAEKLSGKVSSDGIFALIKKPHLDLDLTKHLLYLDGVNDPGNLGTILRTALAFNFGGVMLAPGSVSAYNEKVLSAAQGAHFDLAIKKASVSELEALKKEGYTIIATTLEEAVTINEVKREKVVLILGNEARGVSKEALKVADKNVKIPISHIDSLNVAIAGAILMYELSKNKIVI